MWTRVGWVGFRSGTKADREVQNDHGKMTKERRAAAVINTLQELWGRHTSGRAGVVRVKGERRGI